MKLKEALSIMDKDTLIAIEHVDDILFCGYASQRPTDFDERTISFAYPERYGKYYGRPGITFEIDMKENN